ncbi:MAG: hypothetical protein ABGY95_12815 [Rubritalea sp.]|uniref:hypothetical protein n=1 Tax=Rubritalea sp. TaxID=2109375 RepID=UPI003242B5AB
MLKYTTALLVVGSLAFYPSCSEASNKPAQKPAETQSTATENDKFKKWHDICLEGDTGKIAQQISKFEAELVNKPSNDLARVYLGSSYALKAKHSFFPPTKLKSLKIGKGLMEQAVTSSPNNPRVRMVRAIAYYNVPKRFGTRASSVSDFEFLLNEVKKSKSTLRPNEKQAILYYAFLAFTEDGHECATEARELCHTIDPNSEYGKLTK